MFRKCFLVFLQENPNGATGLRTVVKRSIDSVCLRIFVRKGYCVTVSVVLWPTIALLSCAQTALKVGPYHVVICLNYNRCLTLRWNQN